MLDSLTRADLAAQLTGPVLGPEDEGFAAECAPFNLAVAHRPRVVVGAANSTDVQVAVRFAAQRRLPVAVMATGHQATVPADGAVLITTHRMAQVSIDPAARTARVTAGARWQQVVDAATPFGLAPLNGSSPLVGVVGYTLGGGLSPTMGRAHGWAADHVTALEVVTADGELRQVDAASEPDLFWALRGGKSNFGVVTAMEFALFPVEQLWAGGLFFDGADAAAVLRAYARVTADAPDELSSSIALLRLPALPGVPPSSPTASPCTSASPTSARQPRPPVWSPRCGRPHPSSRTPWARCRTRRSPRSTTTRRIRHRSWNVPRCCTH